MSNITVIGGGRVGGAMSIALARAGHTIDRIVFRGARFLGRLRENLPRSTEFLVDGDLISVASPVVIIASGDPEIRGIAQTLSGFDVLPTVALHTSGSLSSAELSPLAERGVHTASIHPLAAVSDPLIGSERFRGAYFCIEGDDEAAGVAKTLAEALGGHPFSIPTKAKALYHASAVMSAGHVVALLDAAIELMTRCGLTPDEARRALVSLAAGSLANLQDRSPAAALTGPYARGDAGALDRHLDAFSAAGVDSELLDIYLGLAARSVEISDREGRDLRNLHARIMMAKRRSE